MKKILLDFTESTVEMNNGITIDTTTSEVLTIAVGSFIAAVGLMLFILANGWLYLSNDPTENLMRFNMGCIAMWVLLLVLSLLAYDGLKRMLAIQAHVEHICDAEVQEEDNQNNEL